MSEVSKLMPLIPTYPNVQTSIAKNRKPDLRVVEPATRTAVKLFDNRGTSPMTTYGVKNGKPIAVTEAPSGRKTFNFWA